MDRDQQRQTRRNTVSGFSCTAGVELPAIVSPTGRPGADCDPTPAAPIPFTPTTPAPCPAPLPIPLTLPPGLTVSNDLTTAYCPSTAGYSVTGTTAATVTAGVQQQIVLFTAIDNITENQLNYLYEVLLSPSAGTDIINASLSGATSSVIEFTHLNYAQAEELIITIQDAKFTVNTLAVEQARNLLVCQVENNLQVAQCPSGAYFGPTATVPSSLPYLPTATASTGSVLVTFALTPSTGGQTAFTLLNIPSLTAAAAQANSIALAQAESTLRCVYGNAATAAACCTSQAPNNNLGFTYCVPAVGPSIPGSATAIGYFSVSANTVFSAVSLTEANSVARELSRNSLNCYFPSVGITATCAGTGSTSLGLTGLGLTGGSFAPASTTSVYLSPGAVILYDLTDSVTAASEQAATLALASLNCFWSNDAQTVFCPPSGTFTAINNIVYDLAASATASFHYSSSIDENIIISYESKADANTQALELSRANLSCLYCNIPVPPTCSGGVNATIGATGSLICNVIASIAQNTAISLGNILVSSSEGGINCCYGNEGVTNSNKCGDGALVSGDPNSTFTSIDTFFLPANIITICQSTSAPPQPPLFFSYSSLYATNVAQVGCCSDIVLCGGITGSATALPVLWSDQTNLFSGIVDGATFYSDAEGTIPYAFPAWASYVVSRAGYRSYRSITGSTGYSLGLTACNNCSGLTSHSFRGATAVKYSSEAAAYHDIFCGGPTAQAITLYTNSSSPFTSATGAPVAWYTDSCGLSAFNPVSASGATNFYYAGNISGSTGTMLLFSQSGSNNSTFNGTYNLSSCPANRYAYSVYVNSTACSTASGATTLYGSAPAPALFTSVTGNVSFYTEIFGSSAFSYSGTGYVTYTAPDTTTYSRIISGVTAGAIAVCNPLFPVTVQWDQSSADIVCMQPNFYESGSGSATSVPFNGNIRSLWSEFENPFTDSSTAIFYTSPQAFEANIFKPGVSGSVFLSKFTPGDTFRNAYRQYSWSNPVSTLNSYTGTFKSSPFATSGSEWAHTSPTGDYVTSANIGLIPDTKFLVSPAGPSSCAANSVYSDIKLSLLNDLNDFYKLNYTLKKLPVAPFGPLYGSVPVNPSGPLYSSSTITKLLFDGVGYLLSSGANGTAGNSSFILNDLTKVGASFTGAVVRTFNYQHIGNYPIHDYNLALPTYISSFNVNTGQINLGGYYNKINNSFNSSDPYSGVVVIGFRVEASNWTSSQFTCSGDLCNKLEVGHSLYSYYTGTGGVTSSAGYITRIIGNTVYYTGAPSYNNFASYDIGTGASHGSGNVYILGRQFARHWTDEYKTAPVYFNTGSNTYNYMWAQTAPSAFQDNIYSSAQSLIVGNTAGSTALFSAVGPQYKSGLITPRPYSYNLPTYYNAGLGQYFYDSYSYDCNGNVTITTTPLSITATLGIIDTCCASIAPSSEGYGGPYTIVSACEYFDTYGTNPVDPAYFTYSARLLSNGEFWGGPGGYGSRLVGNYIIEGVAVGAPIGTFVRANFSNDGTVVAAYYPCNSTQNTPTYTSGNVWMRRYIGYYDGSDPYLPLPFDPDYPGGGTSLGPDTWSGNNPSGLYQGYVFRDFRPAPSTGLTNEACNCGNFSYVQYSLTSGSRYSIWSSTASAWTTAGQIDQIVNGDPSIPFSECADTCYTMNCSSPTYCLGAPSAAAVMPMSQIGVTSSYQPYTVSFDPTTYDIPNNFDFDVMPSVGGTAEDLKAEATQIAQNLVNSFVRCYYLNEFQSAGECPNPQDFLVASGEVAPGEVVSNISLADANSKALTIATSRRICISPDLIGGAGCASTEILDASATAGSNQAKIAAITMSFSKQGCVFTPNVSLTTDLNVVAGRTMSLTLCDAQGGQTSVNVMVLSNSYNQIGVPIKQNYSGQ